MDQTEARNEAAVAAVEQHAMTIPDVLQMRSAGVADDVIVTQIRSQGVIPPPTSSDIIFLQQQGVSPEVVKALQTAPQAIAVQEPVGPRVVVRTSHVVRPVYVAPPYGPRPATIPPPAAATALVITPGKGEAPIFSVSQVVAANPSDHSTLP